MTFTQKGKPSLEVGELGIICDLLLVMRKGEWRGGERIYWRKKKLSLVRVEKPARETLPLANSVVNEQGQGPHLFSPPLSLHCLLLIKEQDTSFRPIPTPTPTPAVSVRWAELGLGREWSGLVAAEVALLAHGVPLPPRSRAHLRQAARSAAARPQAAREDHPSADCAQRETAAHLADLLRRQPSAGCAHEGATSGDDRPQSPSHPSVVSKQALQGQEAQHHDEAAPAAATQRQNCE